MSTKVEKFTNTQNPYSSAPHDAASWSHDRLQAECWQWAWNYFPDTRRCLFAIPNGGERNEIEAAKFKASGVVPGVLDMCFIWKGKVYFWEFKVGYDYIKPAQQKFIDAVVPQGAQVFECRDYDTFRVQFFNIVHAQANAESK